MVTPIDIQGKTLGFIESRIGGRVENQDSAGIRSTDLGYLVVVCDGMGGMQGGRVASQIAVQTILDSVMSADSQSNPILVLKKAIRAANLAIIEKGKNNANLQGMGTTVTALLLSSKSAITAYVGDSRIYQIRDGKKIFRTFDHSMVFEMVKKKVISEEQARLSAQSNVILKALGIKQDIEIEVVERPYRKGDRFLLCTDGFWGAMPEEDFLRHVSEKRSIDKVLETTSNLVESIGRNNGGEYDNLTAAILEMDKNSKLKEKMTRFAKIIILVLTILLSVSLAFNVVQFMDSKKNNDSTKDKIEKSVQEECKENKSSINIDSLKKQDKSLKESFSNKISPTKKKVSSSAREKKVSKTAMTVKSVSPVKKTDSTKVDSILR